MCQCQYASASTYVPVSEAKHSRQDPECSSVRECLTNSQLENSSRQFCQLGIHGTVCVCVGPELKESVLQSASINCTVSNHRPLEEGA